MEGLGMALLLLPGAGSPGAKVAVGALPCRVQPPLPATSTAGRGRMLTLGGVCPSPRLGQVWGWVRGAGMTWGASWVSSYGTVLRFKRGRGRGQEGAGGAGAQELVLGDHALRWWVGRGQAAALGLGSFGSGAEGVEGRQWGGAGRSLWNASSETLPAPGTGVGASLPRVAALGRGPPGTCPRGRRGRPARAAAEGAVHGHRDLRAMQPQQAAQRHPHRPGPRPPSRGPGTQRWGPLPAWGLGASGRRWPCGVSGPCLPPGACTHSACAREHLGGAHLLGERP